MRLFIAISAPPSIKDGLRAAQRELQSHLPESSVRWTPREQIHLTLRFLGNINNDELEPLKTVLRDACEDMTPMRVQAKGLGFFPEHRAPRVLWAGVTNDQNRLAELQQKIESATAAFGEKPDARPFSAHLTLGRVKQLRPRDIPLLRRLVGAQSDRTFGDWSVNEIELIQSELTPDGARHQVIEAVPLTGG